MRGTPLPTAAYDSLLCGDGDDDANSSIRTSAGATPCAGPKIVAVPLRVANGATRGHGRDGRDHAAGPRLPARSSAAIAPRKRCAAPTSFTGQPLTAGACAE